MKESFSKFRNKQGLTAYALACGYLQIAQIPVKGSETFIHVTLWHAGACYHVRSHDHVKGVRLGWEVFDTLTDARRYWDKQVRELFGEELKSIRKDKRYSVRWEYTGSELGPQYVSRFCGDMLGHSETELQAWTDCALNRMRRTGE